MSRVTEQRVVSSASAEVVLAALPQHDVAMVAAVDLIVSSAAGQ